MPDLIARLLERPQRFDLFQAISLLERAQPDRSAVGGSLGWDEAVRLSADVDLGFAPSDIRTLVAQAQSGPPFTLVSGVMTLAGPQGPLPAPFTEMLIELRRLKDRAALDFLDIFNQRLLGFLYRGRRKHHLPLNAVVSGQSPLLRILDVLSGLGVDEGARGPGGERGWLRHAGLQGGAPRSLPSLVALLRDRLGVRFAARAFEGVWHEVPQEERARLSMSPVGRGGFASGLGQAAMALGARTWDQGAGIELSTPPLPPARFASLLPGGRAHGLLGWLVARHQQVDTRLVLRAAIDAPPPTPLSVAAPLPMRLGLSAWLRGPVRADGLPAALAGPRFLVVPQAMPFVVVAHEY